MAANSDSYLPEALAQNPLLSERRFIPAQIMNRAMRALNTSFDTAAANATDYTTINAAGIPAPGVALANGTTIIQLTTIWAAVIHHYVTSGTSNKNISEEGDTIILAQTPVRGAAARLINITTTWIENGFRDAITNAAAAYWPNVWDRSHFTIRRAMRWFTREAQVTIRANGIVPVFCQKYGIPIRYKHIGFDFLEARFLSSPMSDSDMMAYNAYYLLAIEQDIGEESATNSANFTKAMFRSGGRRRYHLT